MKVKGIAIYADEGKKIAKKAQCQYAEDFGSAFTLLKGETEKDFVEVAIADLPAPRPNIPPYEERVSARVREEYTIDEEFAIQRQRDTNPEAFKAYYDRVEQIKAEEKAK